MLPGTRECLCQIFMPIHLAHFGYISLCDKIDLLAASVEVNRIHPLEEPKIFVANVIAIYPIVIEMFHSKLKLSIT